MKIVHYTSAFFLFIVCINADDICNRGFLVSFLLYNVTAEIGGDLILVSNTLIYFCEQNNGSRFLIYAVVLLFSVNIAIFAEKHYFSVERGRFMVTSEQNLHMVISSVFSLSNYVAQKYVNVLRLTNNKRLTQFKQDGDGQRHA